MSDDLYTDLTVVARHVPDYTLETAGDGTKVSQELPGFIDFGVIVDGVFVLLLHRKAAGLFADIERAKAKQAEEAQAAPADTQPAQG